MADKPAPTQKEIGQALQDQRLPIAQVVELIYNGHESEPGIRTLLIDGMGQFDRNGDKKLNAKDVDPNDSDTDMLAGYNLDLEAMGNGMRDRIDRFAKQFDVNGDALFDTKEITNFVTALNQRLTAAQEGPEQAEPRTTQQALDAFDATLNQSLPAINKPDGPQR